MTKETMTIHRALSELKTLDARIKKTISEGTYVLANKHSNEKIKGVTIAEYKEQMKASHNKVTDLINRRNAIKKAVVLSNATTKVVVGGQEMVVATAIEMKNNGMALKAEYLRYLTYQNGLAMNEIIRHSGETIEKEAEKYVLAVIQAQPKDNKMSVDSEAMKKLRETYIENNTYDLIDPLNVTKLIQELTDEIDAFNVEIDSVLSTSNALTVIEIEY